MDENKRYMSKIRESLFSECHVPSSVDSTYKELFVRRVEENFEEFEEEVTNGISRTLERAENRTKKEQWNDHSVSEEKEVKEEELVKYVIR